MIEYDRMNDTEKAKFIEKEYTQNKKSFKDVAALSNTYANKIRRDAKKFNIKIRDKSEAQKNALQSGKTKHPTHGTKRTSETKQKIGMSVLQSWSTINEQELNIRKQKAKLNWENKTEEEKKYILNQANTAVREAGKTGSKLEKFLLEKLLADGFVVEFHKEQSILNTKLQIDLFIPKLNVAIEVDGPSHFAPVWGDQALNKNKKYDDKKTGLIIGKGLFLIRVKQTRDFSKARGSLIFQKLESLLRDIENNNISQGKVLSIGDE